MKKLLCIFLLILITIITLGFRSVDPYIFSMETYYPLYSHIGCGYLELEIEMSRDDKFISILEDIFKHPPIEGLVPLMTEDTHINSIYLDSKNMVLCIDFSREFMDDTLGSSLEYERLISIVNTLGKFYNIDKVYISIEKKPYESGHFMLRTGEFFKVDFKEIMEIN